MKLELISFKLCPFAQRTVILLNTQKLDFEITYINPMNPPDWFKKISPTGQVPLLKVDDKIVFESSVISEFVNDIGTLDLHPNDVVEKANNRSWIAFSGTMFDDLFSLITGNEEKFNAAKTNLFAKFAKLEAVKHNNTFFNNDDFAMIDVAFSPIFMRLAWINEFTNNTLSITEFKHLSAWSDAVLALDVVKNSVVKGLDDVYYSNIEAREGHLSTLLID
ncbi:Glutathione S-transferase-like [Bathymodiolus heckerae thiotrophic gill symbiont]|uniref:glutathione S-transferase family protein n=1 Tax=Bathymodiolus heckerae thiotrophic gill symbiont TaxID=1052212 RepID=UPI0010B2E91C|nr:glutathione S-transferase family protein [Bathymodiolus heckerae thiotrophic gill symbiont]CAC9435553.1 Glutathione S-transferase-like [uncultured Gammaproteobacteria bacterium]SMN13018.1 Glutathione S-transferase-like [Bathymodiolus heckerae thiotrophic gill symbiont]SMN14838.1 Glutathione S-transferase-like [uncultured Candidatus Thioglobus sp.]